MADESTMGSILNWLRGAPAPTQVTTNLAPPLKEYPTDSDADYARKYGYGYGSGNEPFFNNEALRVLGRNLPMPQFDKKGVTASSSFIPENSENAILGIPGNGVGVRVTAAANDPSKSSVVSPNADPSIGWDTNNLMMRAGLAANRSPIAALGFDPNKTVIDALSSGKNYTLAGAYLPKTQSTEDNMYANLSNPNASSIVHESTHRGFQKLKDSHPEEVKTIMRNGYMPDEETIVRWLMHKNSGDPEGKIERADADIKQRQEGIDAFDVSKYPAMGPERQKALNQLEELAAETKKDRRPGGPR